VVQHLLQRRGAARIALIPPEVLEALNEGLVPTVNLNELLALDLPRLARSVAQAIGLDPRAERLEDTLAMLPAFKPIKRHHHVALALYDLAAAHPGRDSVAHALAVHPSDIARSWAAQWVAYSGLPLPAKLEAVRRFAADAHFGVREMAWMAVRDEVVRDPEAAIHLLRPWATDADANVRRFASEATRPVGVWCPPVPRLKAQPWLALPLLEPLKADASLYVRNSVANWLNDASRTQPDWVRKVCKEWVRASKTAATAYIARRAQRTLNRATTTGRTVRAK
jgi:3-methyladenine DNA glycosylase AlkC